MKLEKYYYLLSLLFVFIIPATIEGFFVASRVSFWGIMIFASVVTLVGSIWDMWATKHGSKDPVWLWQFNHKDTIGITWFDLPIEEYLFFFASSIYAVFTWELVQMAVDTGSLAAYIVLPFVAVWSLLGIGIPYALEKAERSR